MLLKFYGKNNYNTQTCVLVEVSELDGGSVSDVFVEIGYLDKSRKVRPLKDDKSVYNIDFLMADFIPEESNEEFREVKVIRVKGSKMYVIPIENDVYILNNTGKTIDTL